MDATSRIIKILEELEGQLSIAQIRYENAQSDEALILGGKVLGLQEALRTIYTIEETYK